MIFVDSGAWHSSHIPTDPDHAAAQAWLAQNTESLFTTDYIVDETLTLLRARGQNPRAITLGSALVDGSAATLHFVTPDEFHDAWEVFQRFTDKGYTF